MEFDVLNEILYDTCTRLFSNKPIYNFRKNQQALQENNIQIGSQKSSLNTSIQSSQSQGVQQQQQQLAVTNNFVGVNLEPTSENWIQVIGPQKLQQSLRKLGIDLPKLTKRDLEVQSIDQLQNEKKRVKNELKSYDAAFQGIFGRYPQRNEKEPMRPLYIYYKKLKQYIDKAPIQIQEQVSQNRPSSSSGQNQGYLSQGDIIKKIDELKKVRSELRDKLNTFQNEFTNLHNRKIRFHRDIAPVEKEYKMYKDIKGEIQKYEAMIKK